MVALLVQHGAAANTFLLHHGSHLLMLASPLVLLACMFTVLELTRPDAPARAPVVATWWLALVSAAAAAIHLAVVVEHLGESVVLGAFFLALGAAQGGYAAAVLLRPGRRLLVIGLVSTGAVVLLWAYTRTVGVPFGLGPREPAQAADLVATALQVGAMLLTSMALRRPAPHVAHATTSSAGARPQVGSTTAS